MTGPADTNIRVLLVDDQEGVRSGLRRILHRRDGFVIVAECADGSEVPAAVADNAIDVIVMDLRMHDVDGIEATRRLHRTSPHPPVLALTTFDNDELLAGALRAGVSGYVLKDSPAEDLIRAVRAVAAGDAWLDAAVTSRVLSTYRQAPVDHPPVPSTGQLTTREFEVLRAVGRGMTNAEIADALVISEVTVKTHVGKIFVKLGLRDRASAIVYAFDNGIVSPGRGAEPDPTPMPIPPQPAAAPPPEPVRPATTTRSVPRLRIALLGPLRAWHGGAEVDLGPVRQQALLAALMLTPDVTVSQRELLERIWGGLETPEGNVIQVYVYRLRKRLQVADGAVESVIVRDRGGYRFITGGVWLDTMRLAELTADAAEAERTGDLRSAVDLCSRALDLFQGEPLAGLPGPFATGERIRLAERRTALALRKLELRLRSGAHAEVVAELSALTKANPHSEPMAALLMRALYAAGRQADALAVYAETRRALVADLGVEPGELLRGVHGAVLRGECDSAG